MLPWEMFWYVFAGLEGFRRGRVANGAYQIKTLLANNPGLTRRGTAVSLLGND
jgi:hypothetical protein